MTKTRSDGTFTALVQNHVVAGSPIWILIDGVISQDILEQMHSTLDDNKTLILSNGEVQCGNADAC